ncbi:DHH family phosphoesterase [Laceyella putida]|uniref:Bifunctional oligoribonuclease/PAP phosphatase NrnA n=1 Tax=Laceyella putida TaxID=110101 RepID=A0ABW2RNY7_9BACL
MNWIQAFEQWIKEADQVLVVSHIHPDGDAISSTLAMGMVLKAMGKQVTMVNESPIPKKFAFLPGMEEVKQAHEVTGTFNHVVALDCADRARMGTCCELIAPVAALVNIDHHATNDGYGTMNVIFPQAAATVEILYDWIDQSDVGWDVPLATCIYTGLLTDTGGFRYSNTSPKVLRQAAKLVELGIPSHQIADQVLETVTLEQLKLLQTALGTLKQSEDGLVAWMKLDETDLARLKASHDDLDGIVNYARNILGVDVGVLFRETEPQGVKVSLRSRERVDVGQVAKQFGGGGHSRAAGCTIRGTIEEAEESVLAEIRSQLRSGTR